MACATPVIAFAAGGALDIIEDAVSGMLVAPGDIDGFVSAARDVLTDRDKASRFGNAGRMRCEDQFGIAQNVEQIQSVYDDVLGVRVTPKEARKASRTCGDSSQLQRWR